MFSVVEGVQQREVNGTPCLAAELLFGFECDGRVFRASFCVSVSHKTFDKV